MQHYSKPASYSLFLIVEELLGEVMETLLGAGIGAFLV
jgi:hypothetical protein